MNSELWITKQDTIDKEIFDFWHKKLCVKNFIEWSVKKENQWLLKYNIFYFSGMKWNLAIDFSACLPQAGLDFLHTFLLRKKYGGLD